MSVQLELRNVVKAFGDVIAFPLIMCKMPIDKIRKMTEEVLELEKLPGFGKHYPSQLSGRQQQRIERLYASRRFCYQR